MYSCCYEGISFAAMASVSRLQPAVAENVVDQAKHTAERSQPACSARVCMRVANARMLFNEQGMGAYLHINRGVLEGVGQTACSYSEQEAYSGAGD